MESALNDFPNLKALGGFDAFPDVGREGKTLNSYKFPKVSC